MSNPLNCAFAQLYFLYLKLLLIDDGGLPEFEPLQLLKKDDKREPYPLSWDEQDRLFTALPLYLQRTSPFKVNTDCREQEVCQLRWEWEMPIPELNMSVFIIPKHRHAQAF